MKYLLFVQHPYALGILKPIAIELEKLKEEYMWFIPEGLASGFGNNHPGSFSSDLEIIYRWSPSIIFCPGNEVPYWMPGLKVQIFHGLAGEKKGHFRIRHYFDLYLTPGPWFTSRFNDLALKHGNFAVKETGWSKLDVLFSDLKDDAGIRSLKDKGDGYSGIILYAPTFSPSLTSAPALREEIFNVASRLNLFLIIKFHDLTDKSIVSEYKEKIERRSNCVLYEGKNILPAMHASDIMVSDTSSVIYEFMLLDKPVVTLNTRSGNPLWYDLNDPAELPGAVEKSITDDPFKPGRKWYLDNYHPYTDGKSSERIIKAAREHAEKSGVPPERDLSWFRRIKINRMFGRKPD